jgi:hypothetical protein
MYPTSHIILRNITMSKIPTTLITLTNPNKSSNTLPQAGAYISYKPSLEETSKQKAYSNTPSQTETTWSRQYKDL